MSDIIILIYLVIGLVLSVTWWMKYYEKKYNELQEKIVIEHGMISLFMLCMLMFWPCFIIAFIFKEKYDTGRQDKLKKVTLALIRKIILFSLLTEKMF